MLKVSYYRPYFNEKEKRWEPTYRVMTSQTWRDRRGATPGEPFPRAAPGKVFSGAHPDADMSRYVRLLYEEFEIDKLAPSVPESYNPHELYRLATDPVKAEYTRIITIGTDQWHKSYYYPHQQTSREQIARFVKCEKFVSRVVEHSLMIRTGVERASPMKR